jgi:four helix bundle protein
MRSRIERSQNSPRHASAQRRAQRAKRYGRFSFKENRNVYEIPHGSASELQSDLYVTVHLKHISKEEFDEIYDCAGQVSQLVEGSVDNLTRQIAVRRRDRGKRRSAP